MADVTDARRIAKGSRERIIARRDQILADREWTRRHVERDLLDWLTRCDELSHMDEQERNRNGITLDDVVRSLIEATAHFEALASFR